MYSDLSTENLRYLTVDQSLADIAHFIAHITSTLAGASASKVFVFGHDFGGSLALWFRQKYPHLTAGAYVAGAPVLGKLNHFEFNENVGADMVAAIGQRCHDDVSSAFAELDVLAEAAIRTGEFESLNTLLQACNNSRIASAADVAMKYRTLSETLASIAN